MSRPAHALRGVPLVMRGVAKTVFSVFEVPKQMMAGAPNSFPFGLVAGTAFGAARAVAGTLSGAVDMAKGAAPYAKYAVFAI